MQAIELIVRDDFLAQYNISIDTSDVMKYMRKATRVWTLEFEKGHKFYGKYYNVMNFKENFAVELAEVITSRGFCYSFNIVDAIDLLRTEKYEKLLINYLRKFMNFFLVQALQKFSTTQDLF